MTMSLSVAQESLLYKDRRLCHLAVLRIDRAHNAAQTAPPRTNEQSPCRPAWSRVPLASLRVCGDSEALV